VAPKYRDQASNYNAMIAPLFRRFAVADNRRL
jgi:hypothetical protein